MSAAVRLLVLLSLILAAAFARAEAPSPKPTPTPTAKLAVGARTIFVFRSAIAGFPPQDRADGARKRLDRVLAAGGAQRPSIRSIGEGTQVLLDGQLLFLVTPADVNALAGDTTDAVAADSAAMLGKALLEQREQGSPRYLLTAGAWCLAATVAYVLGLRGLGALHRRIRVWTTRSVGRRLDRIRVRNVALLDAGHVVRFVRQGSGVLAWSLRLFATFLWASFLLGHIPYFRSWHERLSDYLLETALEAAASAARAVPGLLVVAAIAALARLAILTAGSLLRRVESGELQVGWLDRDTALPTRRLLNVGIVLFALAMAYPYLPGAHTAAFQGVTVLAGLMVSIGGSSLVAQGASGLILTYTRSLRKGDYVRIGESEGTVLEIGMFETRLHTGLGAEVSIPNALVLSHTTKNFSRTAPGAGHALEAAVTVGYDTPWRQVHAMLRQAARETEGILADPAPYVIQAALSDFYIGYRLVAQAGAASPRGRAELQGRLHQRIVDVFNLNGVSMTSPHFVQEPVKPHVVPPSSWSPPPAAAQAAAPATEQQPG